MSATPRATDLSIPRGRFYRRSDILAGLQDAEKALRTALLQHDGPVTVAAAEKAVRDWTYYLDEWDARD